MKKNDFWFDLPEELIAQSPIFPRDSSRMLVFDRKTNALEHKHFFDICDFFEKGDVFVINNTKVLPSRLYGAKSQTGGKIEFLLLKRISLKTWEVALKPGRIAKVGTKFEFGQQLCATVLSLCEGGTRIVEFQYDGIFEDILGKIGEMPLPHYIKEKLADDSRYNTVYSKIDGSAAAPTAGLHFTPQLIQKLKDKGIVFVEVLLHVGLGTFRPVKVENIFDHKMHSEHFEISQTAANTINDAKRNGKKIVAVGTTSVRVLESCALENGQVEARIGETAIFLFPGKSFKIVDCLVTNFHLPESTLIMLVSAFMGRESAMDMYKTAIENRYRFFSFGDSTLIL